MTSQIQGNHRWYSIRAAAGGIEIFLYGEIAPGGAKQFIQDLQRLGDSEPITIRINSTGGDLFEGLTIANSISRRSAPVTTQIDGLAASVASLIALAGNPVRMVSNAMLMIHEPASTVAGNPEELQNMANTLDKLRETMITTYAAKTKLPREQIAQMLAQETWMDSAEALKFGFVDEVIEALKAAASINDFDLRRFRNAPSDNQLLNQNTHMQTPTANNEQEIKAKVEELYKAKLNRDKEIDDIVTIVRKRDKKDFNALAAKFKQEDKSADAFARAIATSEEFKQFSVIGSGVEPAPGDGVTAGSIVVNDPKFRAILDSNAGTLPQGTRLRIQVPDRSFWPRAVTPLTTRSLDFGIQQLPGVVPLPQQRLYVADLMTNETTTGKTVRYLRENSFTPAATTVAEGAAKPEQLFDVEKEDAEVEKIAAWTKVGDETIADFPQIQSLINMRLPFAVSFREEAQLLNGSGTSPDLLGIQQTTGLQTVARGGADLDRFIQLYHAITLIRSVAFMEPDGIVMNPTDFETVRTQFDGNQQFMGGGPFTGAYGNPLPNNGLTQKQYEDIWRLPVAVTVAQPQGTVLVGAFKLGGTIWRRTGMTIEITNCDQDDFVKNLVTIRAEERLTMSLYFPTAFVQCTGF
jgi:HK97 family phage major capsid protein